MYSSQTIVGRDTPLRALGEALDAAAAGSPGVALVSGEAGIGKTRLVTEVEAAARARGFVVLHGECLEFGGEALAYAPVIAALRHAPLDLEALPAEARGVLAAVLPREPPGPGDPARLHELLLTVLPAPLLLVLEDLHWADHSTLALLAFLARNLRSERILVVATFRVVEALRWLGAELARRRGVLSLALEPLTVDEIAQLLEAIAGEPLPAALAADVHARAGGNPFFAEELFAAREATVREAVLARVAPLDGATLALLAAAGGQAAHELIERLEVDPLALRAALDAGVLALTADGIAFRHGLIGEVIYARLLPAERAPLHRAIAAALHDAPAAMRADQYRRAGLRAEALAASIEAGIEAAGAYAYAEALVHFERALELGEPTVEVLARAAQAARFAGDPERAVELCRYAIALSDDPAVQARLYERLGEFHFWDDAAALACYDRALALAPGEPRLLAARGHALMGLRRWAEARACCEAALDAGAGPRITLGVVLAHLGELAAGEAHLRRALELAADGEETARAYMHLGELLRVGGDRVGALAAMDEGERAAARLGLRASFGDFMYVNGADDLLRLGRWDEAAERLDAAARRQLPRTAAALRRATAGLLYALRGELDAARRELDAAGDDDLPDEFLAPLAVARAELALASGDRAAARTHVLGALDGVQDRFYSPPLYSLGMRAQPDPALLAGLEALLDGGWAPPAALAHLELARGHWAAAAAAFAALGEPHPEADARLREAEALLVAGGERAAALRELAAAHATATALGARPLVEAAEALARRARIDLAPVRPVERVAPDASGLTARELEVLRLLADGLTNREIAGRLFISQKTVGAHVAHIYEKLGVHGRVEAAARLVAYTKGAVSAPPEVAGG